MPRGWHGTPRVLHEGYAATVGCVALGRIRGFRRRPERDASRVRPPSGRHALRLRRHRITVVAALPRFGAGAAWTSFRQPWRRHRIAVAVVKGNGVRQSSDWVASHRHRCTASRGPFPRRSLGRHRRQRSWAVVHVVGSNIATSTKKTQAVCLFTRPQRASSVRSTPWRRFWWNRWQLQFDRTVTMPSGTVASTVAEHTSTRCCRQGLVIRILQRRWRRGRLRRGVERKWGDGVGAMRGSTTVRQRPDLLGHRCQRLGVRCRIPDRHVFPLDLDLMIALL
mmetsp:Transcript_3721/g.9345  ORF Transcript_3721/g.9345 Transcript_3721/m.9345 type:complete len:280 (-) Transcript_3721:619-1458(-)